MSVGEMSILERSHLHGFVQGDPVKYNAVVLRLFDGMSLGEVARSTGLGRSTVLDLCRRYGKARRKWRDTLTGAEVLAEVGDAFGDDEP